MGLPSACEHVTNAELFDGALRARGKLQRDVGHVRVRVFVHMCLFHLWNIHSGHINLTVRIITCVKAVE